MDKRKLKLVRSLQTSQILRIKMPMCAGLWWFTTFSHKGTNKQFFNLKLRTQAFNFPSVGNQHVTYLDLSSHLSEDGKEQTNVPINCFKAPAEESGNPPVLFALAHPFSTFSAFRSVPLCSLLPAVLSRLMYIHLPLIWRTQPPVKTKSSPIHDMILFAALKGPRSEGGPDPEDTERGEAGGRFDPIAPSKRHHCLPLRRLGQPMADAVRTAAGI